MDPIFSAGVYLAMYSGKTRAQSSHRIAGCGRRRKEAIEGLRAARPPRHADLLEMVEGFYTRSFIEVFFEPRDKFNLPSAVTALLAGELEGGWKICWRLRLFFWIVRIQSRWPMLPSISFDEMPERGLPMRLRSAPLQVRWHSQRSK